MATTTDEVARGDADVALKLAQAGPRDALTDPRPEDIIPDSEEKGYHVGEVRQPAEPVLHRGGDVTFESDGESKFAGVSLADLKAAHNKREAKDPAYAGVLHTPDADLGETRPAAPMTSRNARAEAVSSNEGGSATKAELRERLTALGVAEADQPASRASHADLAAAVSAAEANSGSTDSTGGSTATSTLESDANAVANAQAAEDRS